MITINSYTVCERFVYQGVSEGVEALLKDVNNFSKPDVVVETLVQSVMSSLCEVLDFSDSPIRLTPDIIKKIYLSSQVKEETPPLP